ncbi:Cof-type HAD-IIB family hydrolase [Mucisphaera calidilacus]|uniref:Stress response protein YhaX n=1 Tax=Mucisphaera calidilacus TaxID=2527982 RepID=A0A518BUM3_9BACT|nr:HAD family hydrolase [Mucisphaera calidilacus]QDU70651.1 Stress response protein YhaX [Mucisphaera calidilacus]
MRNTKAIQLIACDVDGTLIDASGKIPENNRLAIAEAARRGVRFVLASARPPRMARPIYDALGLDTYQVNYNGAVIQRPADDDYAVHLPIEPRLALRVIETARAADPELAVSLEIKDRWLTDGLLDGLETATSLNLTPDYLGPLEPVLVEPVTKILLLTPPARMPALRSALEAALEPEFGGHVRLQVSDEHLVQVVNVEADKEHAAAWVAQAYGISMDAMLAIGDAPNDAGMLRAAGVGVAVGGAWDEARAAADCVSPCGAAEGAVAWAIERFVLDR